MDALQLEEPSAKRRKISRDAVDTRSSPPAPFSDYIVLARTTFPTYSTKSGSLAGGDIAFLEVSLQDITPIQDGYEIGFSLGRQRAKRVTVEVAEIARNDLEIMEDAQKLDSTARYKAPAALPLACAYATVRELDHDAFILDVSILWENTTTIRDKVKPVLLEMLARYLPPTNPISPTFEPWEPRQFYDNVHVPEKAEVNSEDLKVVGLESQLYPFQRRGVAWLLSREGVVAQPDGTIKELPKPFARSEVPPQGFEHLSSSTGGSCYVNHVLGVASTELSTIRERFTTMNGGILADEMGLGKTLEIIALVCLHPRPASAVAPKGLRPSSATLIITPPSILEQWKAELQEHAPTLDVFHYTGVSDYKKSGEKLIDTLVGQDVVLTTYNVIAKEIHYVQEKPDRNLRNSKKRKEPPKSPLTQISWWRTILDEAQMIESGVSAAGTVARLIPRNNAWAVTGTPLRKGHRDLFGLLLFLRYEPWCRSPRLWDYLVTYHRPLFRHMLGEVALRHSKEFVREDLRLPPQSRHTITVPFTPIEEQHYTQLFQEFCEDCELDHMGAPREEDWDPESPAMVEKMRTWLTRLRQTCLHPEVGGRNRRALGRKADGPLRTVEEVLDVMIDQQEAQLRTSQRTCLTAKIRRGQLKENAKESKEALDIWKEAHNEAAPIVQECLAQFKQESALLGAEKEKEDGEEPNARLLTLQARLRVALETLHVASFFMANAYYQLKSAHPEESEDFKQMEKQETKLYEKAKIIRTDLLKAATRHVNKMVTTIRKSLAAGVTEIPTMEEPSDYGGIESRKIFEKIHFYCEAMNLQAEQFRGLRSKMADFLSQALIDEDEKVDLQGDEYESSTKHQDEMYAYMEALRALLADRTDAISGQENMLIKQEMKGFLAKAKEGEGPAPELMLKLMAEREQKRVKVKEVGSLRGLLAEMRATISSLQWQEGNNQSRASQELAILEKVLKHVQQLGAAQTKALSVLEQDINHFRDTMNSRLAYYRALQRLSDQVAPYREESVGQPLDDRLYQAFLRDEAVLQRKIDSISAKLRYLVHMKTDETKSTEPRICVICTDQFEVGSMTSCGHQFCKEVSTSQNLTPSRQTIRWVVLVDLPKTNNTAVCLTVVESTS